MSLAVGQERTARDRTYKILAMVPASPEVVLLIEWWCYEMPAVGPNSMVGVTKRTWMLESEWWSL